MTSHKKEFSISYLNGFNRSNYNIIKTSVPSDLFEEKKVPCFLQSLLKIQEVIIQGHTKVDALQRRNCSKFPYNI